MTKDFSHHESCKICILHKNVNSVGLGGDGAAKPDVLIIGDSPFRTEDTMGVAFAKGVKGNDFLRDVCQCITAETGLQFRYTYLVRCMSTKLAEAGHVISRTPSAGEVKKCRPYLEEEISMCAPKVIILAGACALKAFLGSTAKVGDTCGKPIQLVEGGIVYIPIYNPGIIQAAEHNHRDNKGLTAEQYRDKIIDALTRAAQIAMGEAPVQRKASIFIAQNAKDAMDVMMEGKKHKYIAVDVESNSYRDTEISTCFKEGYKLTAIGFSWKDHESAVIPLQWVPEQPEKAKFQPSFDWQQSYLRSFLESPGITWDLQNGMYDFVSMHLVYGVKLRLIYRDLILLHHTLWSHLPHGLTTLTSQHLPDYAGYERELESYIASIRLKKERGYHCVPFPILAGKCGHDVICTRLLIKKFWKQVMADPEHKWGYEQVMIPVTHPLMQTSLRGQYVNPDTAARVMVRNRTLIDDITSIMGEHEPAWQKFEEATGAPPDVNSSDQRQVILFHKDFGALEPIEYTKKGAPVTDKDTLEELATTSDLALGIQKIRQLEIVEQKMLKPLPKYVGWDGRIHPNYRVFGTKTFRLASSEPNGQNYPVHSLFMFEAGKGRKLLVADISQAEIRMGGIVCNEPVILNAYKKGIGPDGKPIDIHASVGSEMFGKDYMQVKHDDDLRKKVKGLNFSVLYGTTEFGLSASLGVPHSEAKKLIDDYFIKLPRMKLVLFDETKLELLENGYIRTITGHKWHATDAQKAMMKEVFEKFKKGKLFKHGKPVRDMWEHFGMARMLRQAANCKVQGPTNILVQLSLIKFERLMNEYFSTTNNQDPSVRGRDLWEDNASIDLYLNNEVHDSIIVEPLNEIVNDVALLMKQCMENPEPLPPSLLPELPIKWVADVKCGTTMKKDDMIELELTDYDFRQTA